ncbi:MAG: NADH-quinone oxidoreductase subunit L [Sphingobacteriaceae bacterium]
MQPLTAMSSENLTVAYALLAVLLPFFAFLVNFFVPRNWQNFKSDWISSVAIFGSFVLSIDVFFQIWNQPAAHIQISWFTIGDIKVHAGILLNNLSALMLLLVSAIALPVHIYSIAYLRGDTLYRRYFTYLSFFCFAMMMLVIVDNLLLLYAFWELVGFASYLLIGFWFTRNKAVQANKKAFIMNRIGDIGLLIGIMILFSRFHTFDIVLIFGENGFLSADPSLSGTWLTIAGVCFFLGAMAKSAQFPLHTWLPAAMEGPTSVSALIHAATMVAAGVFLLGRVYAVFNADVLLLIAITGIFTAFMAATIALTQNDLKKILAYSTISQLGFMVLAMGIGAYSSALFHLVAHAFFKCLLFLSAGVIIHEMQHLKEKYNLEIDPQSILYMGGLRKLLPVTFITCCVAGLALIGLPLTSGYLSKDGILIQSFEWSQGKAGILILVPILALITSWLTAFYVARLIFKVFIGDSRLTQIHPNIKFTVHKESWLFRLPMMILAICCLFPLFSWHPLLYEDAWLYKGFITTAFFERMNIYHTVIPAVVNIFSVVVIYVAYLKYLKNQIVWMSGRGFLFRLSYNQWYIDLFYDRVIVRAVLWKAYMMYFFDRVVIDGFVNSLAKAGRYIAVAADWFDRKIIDGLLDVLVFIVRSIGDFSRRFQNGKVQHYLLTMLVVILGIYLLKNFI